MTKSTWKSTAYFANQSVVIGYSGIRTRPLLPNLTWPLCTPRFTQGQMPFVNFVSSSLLSNQTRGAQNGSCNIKELLDFDCKRLTKLLAMTKVAPVGRVTSVAVRGLNSISLAVPLLARIYRFKKSSVVSHYGNFFAKSMHIMLVLLQAAYLSIYFVKEN